MLRSHSDSRESVSRAQYIADQILSSDRFANSRAFADRLFEDEPILRTGASLQERQRVKYGPYPRQTRMSMPAKYRKMRALARGHRGRGYATSDNARLFYEQAKFMEDFTDSFDGLAEFFSYFPTYEGMSDYQLRCYFTWRTRYREGQVPDAPTSFLFVHAYELLCGVSVEPGAEGYAALEKFYDDYAATSTSLERHLSLWMDDYVVFHGLDVSLYRGSESSFPFDAVSMLKQAQNTLIDQKLGTWPVQGTHSLPNEESLLDALMRLSRYRAEKSRYVKQNREVFARVACAVFAKMVDHCHKRRKTDYLEGLFGNGVYISYTMFSSAVFWSPKSHEDVEYDAGDSIKYVCLKGFWYQDLPCRRTETSKELGALLHAIDVRLRVATGYGHPLKERSLPKYQGKIIDNAIQEVLEEQKAREAARIRIDRSSLGGIRSAAARTREALLTEDEREEGVAVSDEPAATEEAPREDAPAKEAMALQSACALELSDDSLAVLCALLGEGPLPTEGGNMYLTLAVDSINDAFLDIVGDTVVEFDGDVPVLVEDYVEDVRAALE